MTSPHTKQEICLLALRGECRAGEDCPRFHARNRPAALFEHGAKKTTRVCVYHLRGSCTRGNGCRCLHVLPASVVPPAVAGDATCEAANCKNNAAKGSKGEPCRPVPQAVRLASIVRGKVRELELTAKRSHYAKRQKKAFERELELMAARLETVIQASRSMVC